jgi:lycopene beta-cyclase
MSESPMIYIVGGGLSGGLFALALKSLSVENFVLLEKSSQFGGHHTWSFHRSDISDPLFEILRPSLTASWDGYEVRFPKFRREFSGGYHTLRAEKFNQLLHTSLNSTQFRLDCDARILSAHMVQVGNERLTGTVVDARNFALTVPCAYQKFVGWDVVLKKPHGLTSPILMDATVEQREGYRFVYTLPLDAHTVLIEDTRYSDTAGIQPEDFEFEIQAYALKMGGGIQTVLRREQAALPLPLKMIPEHGHLQIGLGAGFFNYTTGYSLPAAARTAEVLAQGVNDQDLFGAYEQLREEFRSQNQYFCLLNRMLFGAAESESRRRIFEQFYARSESTIERFYAMKLTAIDRLRILWGRPPVPISKAVKSLLTDSWIGR